MMDEEINQLSQRLKSPKFARRALTLPAVVTHTCQGACKETMPVRLRLRVAGVDSMSTYGRCAQVEQSWLG